MIQLGSIALRLSGTGTARRQARGSQSLRHWSIADNGLVDAFDHAVHPLGSEFGTKPRLGRFAKQAQLDPVESGQNASEFT